jgi:hypothetical protein
MTVIQFPKSEDERLGHLLARAGAQLTQETPPEWVGLQLRAHVARHAAAPRVASEPVRSGALLGAANGKGREGGFGNGGPIDTKAWGITLAVVIALLALFVGSGSSKLGRTSDPARATDMNNGLTSVDDEFVPVVSAQRWQQIVPQLSSTNTDTGTRAWVVGAEVPAAQLAKFGLPFDPAHAGEPVRAELLVHPSGEILAVRYAR